MTWFTSLVATLPILKLLLQIAASLASFLRNKQLLDTGAQLEISKMLVAISDKAGIAREIEATTNKMTPDEVLKDMQKSGELRD